MRLRDRSSVTARWHRPLAGLVLIALLAGVAPAMAQTITRSYPLPVAQDDRQVPGELWIRFAQTVIEEDFETYARRTQDDAGRAFVATVGALAAKDVAKARPLLRVRYPQPLAGLMDVIHESFHRFEDLTVISRVTVGEREVFYLRYQGVDGLPTTQGLWFARGADGYQGWVVELADPAELLILLALDVAAEQPSRFRPVPSSGADYSLPADSGGAVRLEFNGTLADFDIFDDTQPPFSPSTALMRQAMYELVRSDWVAYAAHFTPLSAANISAWVSRQPPSVLDGSSLPNLTLRVLFEIPVADGGAWMFYSQGFGPDHDDDTLKVSRTAGDGRGALKLTSYHKRDLVMKAIMALPGFPARRGPLLAWIAKHRVGGTR